MSSFIERAVAPILGLPRITKRVIAIGVDAALCVLTVWLAFYLRLGYWVSLSGDGWPAAAVAVVAAPAVFIACGLYRTVFRYVSWEALTTIFQAHLLYGLFYFSVFTAWGIPGVPRTVGLIQPLLLLVFVAGSRAFGRYWLAGEYRKWLGRGSRQNVLVYGAGSAGRQLAAALTHTNLRVMGFVDDARDLVGSSIGGIRIWSSEDLQSLIQRLGVGEIFLAIPSANRPRRNEILRVIRETGVAVRTLPGLLDLAAGKVAVTDLQPLSVEDLLGRDAVPPDRDLLEADTQGHVVLVTGAGGSIGSELCRQIFAMGPRVLALVEANEFALYSIHRELSRLLPPSGGPELVPLLASVCDEARMRSIFAAVRPEVIYHAAAYKHVPLVEQNVVEGIRNNVMGTLICARLAHQSGVSRFILVSTDKAVRPTNIMGASKRLSEMVLQAFAGLGDGSTRFAMVRFGNVLGSSGSVVPLFRQQIAAGGPVTVTHREVTRYFMTIPEASQLVLQAGALARGGEVFVLDMGEPVRVHNLAVRMIELSGLRVKDERNPGGDIEIVFSGLRPGEKLYEELLIGGDPTATAHPRVMMANESFLPMAELMPVLDELQRALASQDVIRGVAILRMLVPEYAPTGPTVDEVQTRISVPLGRPLSLVQSS